LRDPTLHKNEAGWRIPEFSALGEWMVSAGAFRFEGPSLVLPAGLEQNRKLVSVRISFGVLRPSRRH